MQQKREILFGWPLPKRLEFLERQAKNKEKNQKYSFPLRFQGTQSHFPVYSVEIELPKYRLANGRTQAAQEEYLAGHEDVGSDFFRRDFESAAAQQVQHDLLWKMVDGTELLKYFKDTSNKQDQPLILDSSGFVVNGNRRLCAMRELYSSDSDAYSHFSHIDIVVLPDCSDKDIDELEARLQLQPDIKEDYTWIAKACMLRVRQETHQYTNQQLSSLYGIKESELQAILARLALADDYLIKSGKPRQYQLVQKHEFAFKQLQKTRKRVDNEQKRDLHTEIAFQMISHSDKSGGRLYERIPEVEKHLDEITNALSEEFNTKQSTLESDDAKYNLLGVAAPDNDLAPLVERVAADANGEKVIEVVIEAIDSQKELERQLARANAPLKELAEANAHLRNALNLIDERTATDGIDEQLTAIEESLLELRAWLETDD